MNRDRMLRIANRLLNEVLPSEDDFDWFVMKHFATEALTTGRPMGRPVRQAALLAGDHSLGYVVVRLGEHAPEASNAAARRILLEDEREGDIAVGGPIDHVGAALFVAEAKDR